MDFLMVGDIDGWPNHLGDDEPAIDVTLVPCRAFGLDQGTEFGAMFEYLRRWSRMYFPRTRSSLLEYEVLFFNHPRLSFFTLLQQQMMVEFIGTRNRVTIAYPLSHYEDVQEPWLASPIAEAIPIDYEQFVASAREGWGRWSGLARLRVEPGRPPIFSAFEGTGTFSARIYEQFRPAIAREGAAVWVHGMDGPVRMPEAPAFVSWHYGDTEAWGFGVHPGTGDLHWREAGKWWELIYMSMCYYTSRGEILRFDEALQKLFVKNLFTVYRESASMFRGIVELVDKFGANTAEAERLLLSADGIREEAEIHYLSMEYEAAEERMKGAIRIAREAMDEANRAKNTALAWVYLSQWMATTAAAFLSGVTLWWLMVRRSLYREVTTTQLGRRYLGWRNCCRSCGPDLPIRLPSPTGSGCGEVGGFADDSSPLFWVMNSERSTSFERRGDGTR